MRRILSALLFLAIVYGAGQALCQTNPLLSGMNFGMGSMPFLTSAVTRSVCPENPTGGKGMGGMAIPDPNNPALPFSRAAMNLGQGWKVSPFIKPKAGETVTIMDGNGRLFLRQLWFSAGI